MNSKDLVVISIYDSFWGFSVFMDGKIYTDQYRGVSAEIYKAYYDERNYEERPEGADDYWHSWLKERFPNKTIVVCEDGGIDVMN